MARPTETTDEQIIEAGEAILSAGRQVTGFGLRQRVGSGHPARMMIVWNKYVEEKNKHVLPTTAGLVVPEELLQAGQQLAADVGSRLADVINALYARGLEIAEQSLSAERADVAIIRQQADEELNDAVSSITLLEQQLDDRSAEIEALTTQLTTSRELTQTQAIHIAELNERYKTVISQSEQDAHRAVETQKKNDAERDSLILQIEELRNQLNESHLKEAAAVAEKQISDKTLIEYRKQVDGLASELEKVKSENANLCGKLETMQLQNHALLEKIEPPKPAPKKRPSRAAKKKPSEAATLEEVRTDEQQTNNSN